MLAVTLPICLTYPTIETPWVAKSFLPQLLRLRERLFPGRLIARLRGSRGNRIRVERVVGVSRSVLIFDLGVVFRSVVMVLDEDSDRSAGCTAVKYPCKDFWFVCFLALRGDL